MSELILIITGLCFLLFRVWIVEVKLTKELEFRKRYFSRFFSYYTCFAMLFAFTFWPFNMMVIVAFPILLVTSVWDLNFFRRFRSQDHWSINRKWGLVERVTLHPPVVIVAIYMIIMGARNYIQAPSLVMMAIVVFILFLPFFLLDVRWTKRYKWPEALIVIGLVVASGLSLMAAEAVLWGVPIW